MLCPDRMDGASRGVSRRHRVLALLPRRALAATDMAARPRLQCGLTAEIPTGLGWHRLELLPSAARLRDLPWVKLGPLLT